MITDIRPIVERILRQLVLAGLPVIAIACDDGRAALGTAAGTGGGSGGIGVSTGGAGGATHTGGTGIGTGGIGTGGIGTGGIGTGGIGTGGIGTGGMGTGGMGGAGAGGSDGTATCLPVNVVCGSLPVCPPIFPDAGIGGGSIPASTKVVAFDPNDSRWAELYKACAASNIAGGCGLDCGGFCTAVMKANNTSSLANNYSACTVNCDQPNKVTLGYVAGVCGRRSGACVARSRSREAAPTLGDHLAAAAELEAESVPAFGRLGRDLAAHGAPAELVRAARVAMGEEARHWRRTRELARRRGGRPVKPIIAPTAFASLEDLAIENVVEGCVRETFGAMVAAHQATEARDTDVRGLMNDIAADERGHAALSWRIDEWVSARLGPAFRARRAEAAVRAVAELLAASFQEGDAEVAAQAGLPDPKASHAMLAAAWTHIWQPSFAPIEMAPRI